MDIRRGVVAHPVPSALTAGAVLAALVTVAQFAVGTPLRATIRTAALTTVLAVFAAGFWIGPAAEWYDDR
jgi:hypothetical protein